ncbi:hypothetical protein BLNAU_13215 [Blattamonas nauphoetae]|uniref:Uncharacterized protein n=1 Tax=Blattamonas nauphoetae TaxID=2049346 RepID=A0ABQ9XK50_9EUKA|nr:hypothetical protein BLNAU_13215 [Blattamonas nauphoetae]
MEVSTNPKSVARRTSGETYPPFFDTLLSSPDYIPVLRRIAEHTDVSDPNERILVDFASTILPYIDKEAPLRLPPQPDYLAGSILYLLTEILKLPDPHPQIPSHCVQLLQNLCFNESSYMITLCLLKQLKVRYPGASSPINILLAFVDQTILELARTKEDKGILEGRSLLKIVFSGGWTFLPSIPALQTILQDNTITVELADSMVNSLSTILRKDTESPLHTEQTLSCYGLPPDAPPPSLFEELGILELLLEICFFSSNLKEHLPLSYFILLAYSILPKKEDNQILQVTLEELNTTAEQLQQFRIFIQRCSSYRGLQTALSDAENRALTSTF